MADPRSFTVRSCPPGYDAKNAAKFGSATSKRRDFFGAIGKVGDIEALNAVGGGSIGTGLRNLTSISNSIRTGCGALPTSIGSVLGGGLDRGANWVLENVGIAPTLVDAARSFQPGVANQAFGQAQQIFQKVEQGNFRATDIPAALQDFQNLERLGRSIFTPSTREQQTFGEVCAASPYAVDLMYRAPKYSFLFVVEFIYNAGYGLLDKLDFAFVVKKASRPNVKFVMEDINFYNFRSKVTTKTEFDEMSLTFHDDGGNGRTGNDAMRFYAAYMQSMSPVTNYKTWEQTVLQESEGMSYNPTDGARIEFVDDIQTTRYSSTIGPLLENQKTILQQVNLYHVFDWGRTVNTFQFYNPRITQMQLSDVDMSSNELAEVSMTFNYDSMYVFTSEGFEATGIEDKNNRRAIYPLRYVDAAKAKQGPTGSLTPAPIPESGIVKCDPQEKTNTSVPGPGAGAGAGTGGVFGTGVT